MSTPHKNKSAFRLLTKPAFELFTIIAGILIALFVNDIQKTSGDKDMLASTLQPLSIDLSDETQ